MDLRRINEFNEGFVSFEEARGEVILLGLSTQRGWNLYCKENKKPKYIPSNPSKTYKGSGWISWGHWLGKV